MPSVTIFPKLSFPANIFAAFLVLKSLTISSAVAPEIVTATKPRVRTKLPEFVAVNLWECSFFPPSKVSFFPFPIRTSLPKPPKSVFIELSPIRVSFPKPPSRFSTFVITICPSPEGCSVSPKDKSILIFFLVKAKLTVSFPSPPSKESTVPLVVSLTPELIRVSLPSFPRRLLAPLVPIKISSFVPPLTPSIEIKVSTPCPWATSLGAKEPKSILSFSVTSL